MTAVNEGDRVRLTCGESVIVGVCNRGTSYSPSLWVTPDGTDVTFIYDTSWAAEVLPPPIPDVVGTIVRDKQNDGWQRGEKVWRCLNHGCSDTTEILQRTYGPMTVLWTPEATP